MNRYRTALVTGASSGIGEAVAVRLAADGCEVVLAARRESELERVADRVRQVGGRAHARCVDVADSDACAAAIRAADDEVGGLDLVIANAGIGGMRWAGELEWEACAQLLDVNVKGAVATLTAVLPRMVQRGRGHLVGVTSMAAVRALPHNALYSASKAFLATFLEGLRVDLQPAGVSVTEVRPGFVRTPMIEGLDSPKPFVVEPGVAAAHIVDRLTADASVVAFPWPMAALLEVVRAMPRPVYERAMRAARPPPTPRQPK